jgi:hypothetical protein
MDAGHAHIAAPTGLQQRVSQLDSLLHIDCADSNTQDIQTIQLLNRYLSSAIKQEN